MSPCFPPGYEAVSVEVVGRILMSSLRWHGGKFRLYRNSEPVRRLL